MTYLQPETGEPVNEIQFSDIFIIEDMQRLQDLFSDATGVASIITHPDGNYITRPSNFCTLCESFIGKTETGLAKCFVTDEANGGHSSSYLVIKPYLSGGLWGAGTGITVGGKHLANWLIGQVRNQEMDEKCVKQYADEIGANRGDFMKALSEVPVMSEKQFNKVSEMLFAFVNEISEKAYNNLQLKIQITEREKAAQLLREIEENLSTTLHSIGDAVLSTDKNGLIVNINTKASTLCGWTKADAMGKSLNEVFNIVNSDTREVVVDPVKKVLETGQIIGLANHTVLISKKGIEYQIANSAAPIKNRDGEINGVVLVFSDVTEKYKTEKALWESERSKSVLLSNLPGMAYRCRFDSAWTMEFVSEGFYTLTGYKSEDILYNRTLSFNDLILPEYRDHLWRVWEHAVQFHETIHEEYKIRTADNYEKWVWEQGTPLYNQAGEVEALEGLILDITERKMSEETLHNERLLLRTIIDNIPDAIYTKDLTCCKTLANKAEVNNMQAKSESEVIGKDDFEYYPNELAEKFFADDQLVIQTGKPVINREEYILDGNKQKRWLLSSKLALRDKDSRIIGLVGIGRDITKSRQAEEAMRESEALYRNLVEELPDGVYKSTHDGKFVDVNPAMVKMLGYDSKEELLEIDIKTQLYFKPTDRESMVLQEKLEEMGIYPLKKKDGSAIWVEDHGWYNVDENGNILFHEGVMRDVTERKQADEALRKSEEQHRTILQTAMDGFWVVDMQGRLLEVNETYCLMSGYSAHELLTMHISDVESAETIEKTSIHMMKIMEQGESRFETKHRRRDGSIFDIEASVKYQPAEGGRFVAFMHDITDRKKKEQELIKAKEKAEESDRLKSAFLANMSHEIRTPMNGILGFAELLKTPDLTGEEQQEYIRIIKKSGDRMLNIINDIVDISKIESGQMKVSVSETKINEQTEFIYNFFKPDVNKKGIELLFRNGLPDKEAIISTDKEKVYAILTNLVKNAIKFTSKGSIEFGYTKKGKFLEFYVKDSGFGIPGDRQLAIFDRFIQADIADSRAFQGAGLGLSISKAYVGMLGGKIWVESEEEKGSIFTFTLPYNVKTEEIPIVDIVPANAENSQIKKLKILIVEDDETSELLISMAVRVFSKEMLKVSTGAAAIETCRNNPDIDLIMMDIKMPGMDGYEATREIRLFNKKVYIIAQTAFGLIEEKEKSLEAGCNEYISKPLDIAFLKGLIQNHFKI